MQESWIPIHYRCFYDVPRMIVVERGGKLYLLNCAFDEGLDEYSDHYVAYRLPTKFINRVDEIRDWAELLAEGERLGAIQLAQIEFDKTKRMAIKDKGLELLQAG